MYSHFRLQKLSCALLEVTRQVIFHMDIWKYCTKADGAQFVPMDGQLLMRTWHAATLDTRMLWLVYFLIIRRAFECTSG